MHHIHLSDFITGAKSVDTAAEIFAGTGRLAERRGMIIYNDSPNVIYFGKTGSIDISSGFPVQPGDMVAFDFSPNISLPIYCVAGSASNVRVVEFC